MIGRGAQGNPWIFSEISAALRGEAFEYPDFETRMRVALKQLDDMIAEKGERTGVAEAKKHMAWYMKGLPGAAELRGKLNHAETMEQLEELLRGYLKNHK